MRALLLILLQLVLVPIAFASLPRVAVVAPSGDERTREFTDLLVAELSKSTDKIELVERAQLQRLAQETSIQSLNVSERPLALARLAKADGLIFIGGENSDPEKPRMIVRLTGCSDGLIHRSLVLGGSEKKEDPVLAKLAAGVLRFPAARLSTPGAAPAKVISLLGLRSTIGAHDPLALTLNTALAHQLACQPGLTVAERWKLDDVIFERSLDARELPALTTGTVLLDGSFERKDKTTWVKLRLRGAGVAGEQHLAVEGPWDDPSALAYELAKAVTLRLEGPPAARLDATEEAHQFYELGYWLMARRLGVESVQAFESAVALGDHRPRTLMDRLNAYGLMICPKENRVLIQSPDRSDVEGLDQLRKADFQTAFDAMLRLANHLQDVVDKDWQGFEKAGYDRSAQRFKHQAIFALGEEMLEALYVRKEHLEFADEGRVLRALMRNLLTRGASSYGSQFAGADARVGYVYETPEETITAYRCMLDPKELGDGYDTPGRYLRSHFWHAAKWGNPRRYVIDWSRIDNARGEQAWTDFVKELAASKSLLQRSDALAFSFQWASDQGERRRIVEQYLELAQAHREELLTPAGQSTFVSFGTEWVNFDDDLRLHFQERYIRLLTFVIEQADWAQATTFSTAWNLTLRWAKTADRAASGPSEECAAKLLDAVDRFSARATADPRWKESIHRGLPDRISNLRESLWKAYPTLAESRMKPRPAMNGAVAIHGWRPQTEGKEKGKVPKDRLGWNVESDWMAGDKWVWDGQRLLIPLRAPSIISLDPVTLKSESFPAPAITSFLWNMDACNGTLMRYSGDGVYVCDYRSKPGEWRKLDMPATEPRQLLHWQVMSHGGSLYLGSRMPYDHQYPQHLLGRYEEGRMHWLASSNRLPVQHPFDGKKPRNILGLFPGYQGRPTLYVGVNSGGPDDYQVFDLDSAKFLGELGSGGALQQRGDRLLHWSAYEDEARHILAFDQASETPRLIMRNPKPSKGISPLREGWEKVKPLLDFNEPAFQGDFVAPIGHAGRLWLLKWEKGNDTTAKYNPDDLRLVGVDLTTRKTVVVPLRYDVPETIHRMKGGDNLDMARPRINNRSLIDTPTGLFFTACGDDDPSMWSHTLSPAVLFIRWDDVNAWIRKNHPEF